MYMQIWFIHHIKIYIHKCQTLKEQERVAWEACVKSVKCIKEEKANMPSQLHHLDKGLKEGMTFPRTSLLPFMRMCDLCFREFSSEENFLKFGKSLPNVIKLQMSSHSELKEVFIENIRLCVLTFLVLCVIKCIHSGWKNFVMLELKTTWMQKKDSISPKVTKLLPGHRI